MTQLLEARAGRITPAMEKTAAAESVSAEYIRENVACGKIVIPLNVKNAQREDFNLSAVGKGLRTKVNANIGTSMDKPDLESELEKLKSAIEAGADTVMDLSTGGDIGKIRCEIIKRCSVPLGTVPIYEAATEAITIKKDVREMDEEKLFRVIEEHGRDGVDFITVHCGVTLKVLEALKEHPRVCGIVSRGGTFLVAWMKAQGKENPLYTRFDELIDISRKYDMTISLGDGLRPGAIEDSLDGAQVEELLVLAALARRARSGGVQVMIEGPGHVPLNQIKSQVRLQKELTADTPFYVLGPIVTDIAPGYDHITSAIGGALAASYGADFLCYVTPSEHLSLPNAELVREGVIAARIAAHAGDIAKGVKGAKERDREFSKLRRKRDWQGQIENSLDPKMAMRMRTLCKPHNEDVCSMCGDLCVFKVADDESM